MRRSPLLPIFLVVLVDVLGMTIVMPLLPFYTEKYGGGPFIVGLLVASYAICQLFSSPLLGRLSDRHGRKPLLIVSQAGTLAGFLVLAYARALPLIFLGRMLDGATAGNLSLAQAYISDVTVPEKRAQAFGVIGMAFGIGFSIGPTISGLLAGYGYHYPFLLAAGLSATSILCSYFLLPDRPPPAASASLVGPAGRRLGVFEWKAYTQYFRRPLLAGLLVQFLFFSFTFSLFMGGFALFCERRFSFGGKAWGPRQLGWIFTYVGVLGILLQGVLGKLVRRLGEWRLIWVGFGLAAIGYGILGAAGGIAVLMVASSFSSLGNGVLRPALTSRITQAAGRREQGVVLGLTQSLTSVSMASAPLLAGLLIRQRQLAVWCICIAVVAGAGALVAFRSSRQTPPPEAAPAAVEPGV